MKQLTTLALSALIIAGCASNKGDYDFSRIEEIVNDNIKDGTIPGAVVAVVRGDELVYKKAFGYKSIYPEIVPMTTDCIFDLASLSKCVGTTTAAMQLIERGYIRLGDNVSRYIPGFEPWKDEESGETVDITVRDLMSHVSGLSAYEGVPGLVELYGMNQPDSLINFISRNTKRNFRPGTDFLYSCLNYITLQNVIQNVTGQRLCDYAEENIFKPLGMKHTCYFPLEEDLHTPASHKELLPFVVPTEIQYGTHEPLLGAVHDPLARVMNAGNSGNAGVCSSVDDLIKFAKCLMNGGRYHKGGREYRLLGKKTIELMAKIPEDNDVSVGRALGWDKKSSYSGPLGDIFDPQTSILHTGYTGTSMVIDLSSKTTVIILAARVHPWDTGGLGRMRALIANVVAGQVD